MRQKSSSSFSTKSVNLRTHVSVQLPYFSYTDIAARVRILSFSRCRRRLFVFVLTTSTDIRFYDGHYDHTSRKNTHLAIAPYKRNPSSEVFAENRLNDRRKHDVRTTQEKKTTSILIHQKWKKGKKKSPSFLQAASRYVWYSYNCRRRQTGTSYSYTKSSSSHPRLLHTVEPKYTLVL